MGVVVLGMFFLCFLCPPPSPGGWTLVAPPFLSIEEEVVEASSRDTQAVGQRIQPNTRKLPVLLI